MVYVLAGNKIAHCAVNSLSNRETNFNDFLHDLISTYLFNYIVITNDVLKFNFVPKELLFDVV